MKAIIVLVATVVLLSCSKHIGYKKPFVVIGKGCEFDHHFYVYQDANGEERRFTDEKNKYNIGDTLK